MKTEPSDAICIHCTRYLKDTCIEKCKPGGKLKYFEPKPLNGSPIPIFPEKAFNDGMDYNARQRTVGAWLSWITKKLNQLQKEREGY